MNGLVELVKISPRIRLDIRYASSNNFILSTVFPSSRCFLLRGPALRLHRIQPKLEKVGLGLLVFDGYGSHSVKKIFWSLFSDLRYLSDPAVGSLTLLRMVAL